MALAEKAPAIDAIEWLVLKALAYEDPAFLPRVLGPLVSTQQNSISTSSWRMLEWILEGLGWLSVPSAWNT